MFFLIEIVLARSLGIEKFGSWSYFYSIFSMLLLFSYFGIRASTKFSAEYNNTPLLGEILQKTFNIRLITGSVFAVLLLIIAQPLATLLERPDFTNLFYASSLLIFFLGFVEYLKGTFMGLHRIKYNFFTNLLEYSFKILFLFIALYISSELVNVVYALAGGAAISTIVMLFFLYKDFFKKEASFGQRPITKEILKYSLPLMMISIGFIIATEVDTFMLGWMTNDTEVGAYAAAKRIITKLPHISWAIAMGTMPIFAQLNSENKAKLKKLFRRLLKINGLIFSVIIGVILAFGQIIMPYVFGAEYIASVPPLKILCIYLACASFLSFYNSFLDYRGLAKKRAYNLIFSTILNIVLNYYLIPIYGATGAAIATSISYFPYLILNAWETRYAFRMIKDA